jgi:hypothetical protein
MQSERSFDIHITVRKLIAMSVYIYISTELLKETGNRSLIHC